MIRLVSALGSVGRHLGFGCGVRGMWLLAACCLAGCATNPLVLSPRVEEALIRGGFDETHRDFRAGTYWSTAHGHGIGVTVWVDKPAAAYRRDWKDELAGAARVAASLSTCDLVTRWDFLDVDYFIDYGVMQPRGRKVVGMVRARMKQDVLVKLAGRPAADFDGAWECVDAYKDQPDQKQMLRWESWGALQR